MPNCPSCGVLIESTTPHVCRGGSRTSTPFERNVVPRTLSLVPKGSPLGSLPNRLLPNVFQFLDEPALGLMLLICKRWKHFAVEVLKRWVPMMQGHGSTTVNLQKQITSYLEGSKSVELAVDQFWHPGEKFLQASLLGYMLDKGIKLDLALNNHDPKMEQCLFKAGWSYTHVTSFNKMHNKIWVIDRKGVILGSPNVSFAGLQGVNLESCIMIKSLRVGHLFSQYLELIRCPNPAKSPLWKQVSKALAQYNSEQHQLKLAFAPVMSIPGFIVDNLPGGVTKIIVRQFLIGKGTGKKNEKDVLSTLCGLARKKVDIEIYIDDEAWEKMPFVRDAARELIQAGCKVYTQKPVLVLNAHNEGIQHDKLVFASVHKAVCRTFIGSAGITRDVIANNNWENFICTDAQGVYDSLMAHHLRTLDSKVATTFRILPPQN